MCISDYFKLDMMVKAPNDILFIFGVDMEEREHQLWCKDNDQTEAWLLSNDDKVVFETMLNQYRNKRSSIIMISDATKFELENEE